MRNPLRGIDLDAEMLQVRFFLQPINYFKRNRASCADDIVLIYFLNNNVL